MNLTTIGDLSQSYAMRRQSTALKQQLNRLTTELASGQVRDVTQHLSGNLDRIAHVDHGLRLADSYTRATQEAASDMGVMQIGLSRLLEMNNSLASTASLAGTARDDNGVAILARSARAELGNIVSTLNTANGGRALFAGADTNGSALAPADDILAAARTAVVGVSSAADVEVALDAFFHDPGGVFETDLYLGATDGSLQFKIGGGEIISLDVRADDAAIREHLKATVMAALSDDPALSLAGGDRQQLAQLAAGSFLQNADALVRECELPCNSLLCV